MATEIPTSLPGNVSLAKHDPVMFELIEQEKVSCFVFGGCAVLGKLPHVLHVCSGEV